MATVPRTEVGILYVHGVNAQRENYHEGMETAVEDALPQELADRVVSVSVFWAREGRSRQEQFLSMLSGRSRRISELRKMIILGAADASSSHRTADPQRTNYYRIQRCVTEALGKLAEELGPAGARAPLVVVAHSLGCQIVSSYIWDVNNVRQMGLYERSQPHNRVLVSQNDHLVSATPFMRLETLAGIVTMGNNMPLFTCSIDPSLVVPITRHEAEGKMAAFPGPGLPTPVFEAARWLNFYSENDPFGYPLKRACPAYRVEERVADQQVFTEGRWRSRLLPEWLNMLPAHNNYWRDRTVVERTAGLIADLIRAADRVQPQAAPPDAGAGQPRHS